MSCPSPKAAERPPQHSPQRLSKLLCSRGMHCGDKPAPPRSLRAGADRQLSRTRSTSLMKQESRFPLQPTASLTSIPNCRLAQFGWGVGQKAIPVRAGVQTDSACSHRTGRAHPVGRGLLPAYHHPAPAQPPQKGWPPQPCSSCSLPCLQPAPRDKAEQNPTPRTWGAAGQSWGLRGSVLAQLCHSLHEVLHNQVHIGTGGVPPHTQPQGVLRHLVGDPTAEQDRRGPETQAGGRGFNWEAKEVHTSLERFTEP